MENTLVGHLETLVDVVRDVAVQNQVIAQLSSRVDTQTRSYEELTKEVARIDKDTAVGKFRGGWIDTVFKLALGVLIAMAIGHAPWTSPDEVIAKTFPQQQQTHTGPTSH